MKNKKELFLLAIILLIASFLRFYNLMHDAPYFFNPDERNMANAISQLRLPARLSEIPNCLINQFSKPITHNSQLTTGDCNLNPHFFAYGQFPLYLSFISDQVTKSLSNIFIRNLPINDRLPMTNYLPTSFPSAIFWLRFYSALSSVLTVLFVYLITKELFNIVNTQLLMTNDQLPIAAALMAAFTPGLIQSAHFGTTESILTFFFLASIYFSMKLTDITRAKSFLKYLILNTRYLILLSLTIGLALGSKLTGIFFFIPPFISMMIRIVQLFKKRRGDNLAIGLLGYWVIGLLIVIGSILIFALSSPYNLVNPADFKSAVFGYESDVAMGRYEAFYTRQFVNTTPILFQIQKVFPYAMGWPVFLLGILGFLIISTQLIIKYLLIISKKLQITNYKLQINGKNNNLKIYNSFIILNLSFIIYFLPNAFLFAKWTRFMTPILPFFSIFAVYGVQQIYQVILNLIVKSQISNLKSQNYISNLKSKKSFKFFVVVLTFTIYILTLLPGAAFMSIYTHEDSRLTASKWIYNNLPNNSYVLSETANVVDIPLGIPKTTSQQSITNNYTVISFDFYHMDENPQIFRELLNHLEKSDYIFIPSRRIFANYTKLPQKYPLVTKYYQLLFDKALGFEKVSEINSFPSITFPLYPIPYALSLPDENAEETFTVFDHPVVRIYKKTNSFTIDQYRLLFNKSI